MPFTLHQPIYSSTNLNTTSVHITIHPISTKKRKRKRKNQKTHIHNYKLSKLSLHTMTTRKKVATPHKEGPLKIKKSGDQLIVKYLKIRFAYDFVNGSFEFMKRSGVL